MALDIVQPGDCDEHGERIPFIKHNDECGGVPLHVSMRGGDHGFERFVCLYCWIDHRWRVLDRREEE